MRRAAVGFTKYVALLAGGAWKDFHQAAHADLAAFVVQPPTHHSRAVGSAGSGASGSIISRQNVRPLGGEVRLKVVRVKGRCCLLQDATLL